MVFGPFLVGFSVFALETAWSFCQVLVSFAVCGVSFFGIWFLGFGKNTSGFWCPMWFKIQAKGGLWLTLCLIHLQQLHAKRHLQILLLPTQILLHMTRFYEWGKGGFGWLPIEFSIIYCIITLHFTTMQLMTFIFILVTDISDFVSGKMWS